MVIESLGLGWVDLGEYLNGKSFLSARLENFIFFVVGAGQKIWGVIDKMLLAGFHY